MKVVRGPAGMSRLAAGWRRAGLSIGFVPTMGALHAGHGSLIRRARRREDRVVVSIFVNPAQFGPNEDYGRYPRTWRPDLALCRAEDVDAVYHPDAEAMYPEGLRTEVEVKGLSDLLCGKSRPGHFKGVATVVLKLLAAVRPDRAYFGEKDYQQLVILKAMARDLDLPWGIVGCPILRESDGLALSSRNRYLTAEQRQASPAIWAALREGARAARGARTPSEVVKTAARRIQAIPGARIDYVSLVDARTLAPAKRLKGRLRLLAAVRLGATRLIDNVPVSL